MGTRTFTRSELLDELSVLDTPATGVEIILDRIVSHGRWSVRHELIFRTPGQAAGEAWRVTYSVGATEQQDEAPWEHEDAIEARLVMAREKTVTVWE